MIRMVIIILTLIILKCSTDSNKMEADKLILEKWKGYEGNEYKMSLEFVDSTVIIDYLDGYHFIRKYCIKSDTLFIENMEDSIIRELNKNVLILRPAYGDLRPDIGLIHCVTFRR